MDNDQPINTIGVPAETEPNEESVELREDTISPKMSEADFSDLVRNRIQRAKEHWNKFDLADKQERNFKYWVGNQVDNNALRDDLEKGADNAIFRNIETFLPIATARKPELSVTPAFKNEVTRDFASDVKRTGETEWEVRQGMGPLLSRGIRNHQINLIGIFQVGVDPDTGEYWTEEIYATEVVIDRYGRFLARYIKDETIGDLIERYPEKKEEIVEQLNLPKGAETQKKYLDSPVEYIEAWTDEVVGWKLNELVLGVEENPHFDYEGVEYETGEVEIDEETQSEVPVTQKVFFNHFKKPKMPFLFLTYFNRGTQVIDDTSLIDQAIGPQDWINKRKRQIGANADSTNGWWVSSGDFISQEEFDKIDGSIDMKVWLENGTPGDGVAHITGQELPVYVYNDLVDSRNVIDNLMGTHSTTRGAESDNPTLGQDVLQKQQDYGRVDGYIRDAVEKFAQKWYEWQYHLRLVHGVEEVSIAIPEDDDFEQENVVFSRDKVPLIRMKDGSIVPIPLVFKIQQGSTLPRDEVTELFRAKEVKDAVAPIDLFKMMNLPNPRELAKNALMWGEDPYSFFSDDPDVMEMLRRKAEAMRAQEQQDVTDAANAASSEASTPAGGQIPQGGAGDTPPTGTSPAGVAKAMKSILDEQGIPAEALDAALSGQGA